MAKKYTGELSEDDKALFDAHLDFYPPRRKRESALSKAKLSSTGHGTANLSTRIRRGTVDVDFTLDLHGKTLDEAWRAVDHLLARARGARWRILRIITGKGTRSEGGRGVLIEEIPRRLRADSRVAEVLQAVKPKDGGQGAWFIRVR